jgi:hypothetical protein
LSAVEPPNPTARESSRNDAKGQKTPKYSTISQPPFPIRIFH